VGQPSRHGYRVTRPIGNCADRTTTQSVDVFGAQSGDQGDQGDTWTQKTRVTNYTSNPNYEQFDNRAVPFAGDYFWATSLGLGDLARTFAYTTWTDWRNTVAGSDPREVTRRHDAVTAPSPGSAKGGQEAALRVSSGARARR